MQPEVAPIVVPYRFLNVCDAFLEDFRLTQ